MVPTGWLETEMLPGSSVVVAREAVVSDGDNKGPSEVPVTTGVVEEEVVLVPGDVLPSSVVIAGPWWVLVPSVVPTPVEETRVEVGGGSILISTPNELTARVVLAPADEKVGVLSQSDVMAMEVGVGVLLVVVDPTGVVLVVGANCAEVGLSPSCSGVVLVIVGPNCAGVVLVVVGPNCAGVVLVVGPSPAGVVLVVVGLSCAEVVLVVVGPSCARVVLVVGPSCAGVVMVVGPNCAGVVMVVGPSPAEVVLVVVGFSCAEVVLVAPSRGDTGEL